MKSLVKIMLVLVLFFASTFILLNSTGVITIDKIALWLEIAESTKPLYVTAIVVTLLFADLFVAVPTLTVMILAGYFLGPIVGALSAASGLILAGTCGYVISRKYGYLLINCLIKEGERKYATELFRQHGAIVILLSRATPILPEVSACMAGMMHMSFVRFIALWLLSAIPYAFIAAYAGSMSTLANPKPAIFTAMGLTATCWLGWFFFRRYTSKTTQS